MTMELQDAKVPSISRGMMRKTLILLYMEYSLSELAEILGVTRELIYQSYIPAGLPHRRDENGRHWVVGTEFRAWAEDIAQTSNKHPKSPLKPDECYCLVCRKLVTMQNRSREEVVRKNVLFISGECPHCENRVSRFCSFKKSGASKTTNEISSNSERLKPWVRTSDHRGKGLINRDNYVETQKHLQYRENALQNEYQTLRGYRLSFKHLLEWAGPTPFKDAEKISPTFPNYLLSARKDGKDEPLSWVHLDKIARHARLYFTWAQRKWPAKYKRLDPSWVDSLLPPKSSIAQIGIPKREYWKKEEVAKIMALDIPRDNLRLWRTQAAIVFLYLSAMRASAFLTLPVECVDLKNKWIEQIPAKGVQTKNRKAAITTLLPIREFIDFITEWDNFVRKAAPNGSWYAVLNSNGHITENRTNNPRGMRTTLASSMKELCEMAGVEYKSPHKLRHGHGVYGVSKAKNIKQLQSVSQNMMHAHLEMTTGVYGKLEHEVVGEIIGKLGRPEMEKPVSELEKEKDVLQAIKVLMENPETVARIIQQSNNPDEPG